jgi:hypothetical protein
MIYGVVTKLLCAQQGWCVWQTCEMTANKTQNEGKFMCSKWQNNLVLIYKK